MHVPLWGCLVQLCIYKTFKAKKPILLFIVSGNREEWCRGSRRRLVQLSQQLSCQLILLVIYTHSFSLCVCVQAVVFMFELPCNFVSPLCTPSDSRSISTLFLYTYISCSIYTHPITVNFLIHFQYICTLCMLVSLFSVYCVNEFYVHIFCFSLSVSREKYNMLHIIHVYPLK